MDDSDTRFDRVVAVLVGVVFAVLLAGHLRGAGWAVPAEDGVGPFPGHDRAVVFWVVTGVALVGVVACLFRAVVVRAVWVSLVTPFLLIGVIVVLGKPIYNSHRFDLRNDGFAADSYNLGPKARVRFFNAGDTELTVCLGTGGVCDAGASGPAALRAPGITLPPDHRRAVDMPEQLGDVRLTLVTSGATVTRRDTVIHIIEWD
jgi:hypothetical protein